MHTQLRGWQGYLPEFLLGPQSNFNTCDAIYRYSAEPTSIFKNQLVGAIVGGVIEACILTGALRLFDCRRQQFS